MSAFEVVNLATHRWRAWEFWPAWASYAPLIPWIGWLAARHGGPGTIAAANPGFPDGGLVGESKFDILASLPKAWTVASARIAPGPITGRLEALIAFADAAQASFPMILKPDIGQRGAGVRKVRDVQEATEYLRAADYAVVAQPWHPGPFEAGIFYVRHPAEACGRIFSITDKVFPRLTGDGVRTAAALVESHPRLSRQAHVFRQRHGRALSRVLAEGETFALGEVGNHCQGTLFLDGRRLWTPALEARVDAIARAVPGFYIGRFDVRYGTVEGFMKGEDLAIVELNGVSAEPTDVYDPQRSIWSSYRELFEQWRLIFEIGAANRRHGHEGSSWRRLLAIGLEHWTDARTFPHSS